MHNAGSAPRPSQRAQRPCGCITTRAPPRVACVSGLGRTRAAPAHPRTHERCQPAESPPTALAEGRVWPQHLDVEQSGSRPWHRQALSMRVGAERHRGACATAACSYARRAARARWCSCAVCAVPAAHGEAVLPQGPSIFCSTRVSLAVAAVGVRPLPTSCGMHVPTVGYSLLWDFPRWPGPFDSGVRAKNAKGYPYYRESHRGTTV